MRNRSIVSIALGFLFLGGLLVSAAESHAQVSAATSDIVVKNLPLDQPFRTSEDVVGYAVRVSQHALLFGYFDYRERLQEISADFTTGGWVSYNASLKHSNVIELITAKKLYMRGELEGGVELVTSSVENGVYTWHLIIPMAIVLGGDNPPGKNVGVLNLKIVRDPVRLNSPDGLKIGDWQFTPNEK